MIDSRNFLKNSLFCEWAYIINLTEKQLEVYKGFQSVNNTNRYMLNKEELKARRKDSSGDDYYNCALIAAFNLDDLPSEENFLKALDYND